jgi:hypothetical protein
MRDESVNEQVKTEWLEERLIDIYRRKRLPEPHLYTKLIEKVNTVLLYEDAGIRPYATNGLPGGIVFLRQDIPTILVPDLHARVDFFLEVLLSSDEHGVTNLQKLATESLQIVCVGDGFHAEGRAAHRWALAFEEYLNNYKKHPCMDEEIRESLGIMAMVKEVKTAFPSTFHFLKGNHENITNEYGDGNYSFRKYSHEGAMVVSFMEKFYGEDFLQLYSQFEKNLPLLAVGRNFLVSHAEPATFYDFENLIEYREFPEVIYGLTWTANDEAEEGSVRRMLEYYLKVDSLDGCFYFGGHRPVEGTYNLRADGKYVQFHNPNRFLIAMIKSDGPIHLDEDIFEIEKKVSTLFEDEGGKGRGCQDR